MSEWQDTKREFHRAILATGAWSLTHFPPEYTPLLNLIGPKRAERWLARFYEAPHLHVEAPRRLLNHFKVGADPELYFADHANRPLHASGFNFLAGRAFGADNNGRLAELRAFPSRSALHVVTSLWMSLAWMQAWFSEQRNKVFSTVPSKWLSGPALFEDGLGGHVHVGRRRDNVSRQVGALDTLCQALYTAGTYDESQLRARRQAGYGNFSDTRPQRHGWEYRTFPTWLNTPRFAHLVLTLAKLAVLDPSALQSVSKNASIARRQLVSFLARYRGRDDDAALALAALQPLSEKGPTWPTCNSDDIRPAWGISSSLAVTKMPTYLPELIRPSSMQVKAMFQHISGGATLRPNEHMQPTWKPTNVPVGYRLLWNNTVTLRAPGTGELAGDFVFPSNFNIQLGGNENRDKRLDLFLPTGQEATPSWKAAMLRAGWRVRFERHGTPTFRLHIHRNFLTPKTIGEQEKFLASGLLPLFHALEAPADATAASKQWLERNTTSPRSSKMRGKILYQT